MENQCLFYLQSTINFIQNFYRGGPMRIKRNLFDKINELLTDGRNSFQLIQESFPDIDDDLLYQIYLRKAHHDARCSLRKISNLKLRIDHLYNSYIHFSMELLTVVGSPS